MVCVLKRGEKENQDDVGDDAGHGNTKSSLIAQLLSWAVQPVLALLVPVW